MATTSPRTDEQIKKDVVDQLFWDDRINAADIQVEVAEGTVKLTGSVPTYYALEAATANAWDINDVSRVKNDLTVEFPELGETPPDEVIRNNIKDTLSWTPGIDASGIDVAVKKGWVTLEGSVKSYWRKNLIDIMVSPLRGIVGITNKIKIVPTEKHSDEAIAENITRSLERKAGINVDAVDIKVKHGEVTLSGKVPSWSAYVSVYDSAKYTPGVIDIKDDIFIGG